MSHDLKNLSILDFTYTLPDERIARFPLEQRDASKLLVYANGSIADTTFNRLPDFLKSGDRMVFNETKVIHARLLFHKETGGTIEVFCLEPANRNDPAIALMQKGESTWQVMIGNAKRWKEQLLEMNLTLSGFDVRLRAERLQANADGERVRFSWNSDHTFSEIIDAAGKLPIPPYLKREAVPADESTYQTVYARNEGSVAAPTAGLHFTPDVLQELSDKGIDRSYLTLHVGAGTFKPVKADTMAGHEMHREQIDVDIPTLEELHAFFKKRESSGEKDPERLIAVGTTSLRTLESLYWMGCLLLRGDERWTVDQWTPYDLEGDAVTAAAALEKLIIALKRSGRERLTASTSLLIGPGY
ncbi:MAG: hypothetical protein RL021_1192, partial [Bacteroidota bacterium]